MFTAINKPWIVYPEPFASSEVMDGLKRFNHTYLHGEMEKANGYDIFNVGNCELPTRDGDYYIQSWAVEDGIYRMKDCNNQNCLLFLWNAKGFDYRGLCVYETDIPAVSEAVSKYNRRLIIL
jgi:hypothetical protein